MSTRPLWFASNKELVKKEVPKPTLGPKDVLIKTKAIAFNPTDYKHLDYGIASNSGLGCDFAGDVVEVGTDVTLVKVGDTVSGVVSGGKDENPEGGSFTTLVKAGESQLLKFPHALKAATSKHIDSGLASTYEQAASLPVGLCTTVFAFESYNRWDATKKGSKSGYALIYGAVSSLGFVAAQAAAYLGFDVIAVASKKHAALLKSVGITTVVDYHDADWVEQVRKIGGDDITYAYDTISFPETLTEVVKAVSTTKPVKINVSLPGTKPSQEVPSNVKIDAPLAYLLIDPYKDFGVRIVGEPHFIKDAPVTIAHANVLLEQGAIRTLPVEIVGEGIDAVPTGLAAIRKGVSGEKVTISL